MLNVIAAPGLNVPREDNPRTYIAGSPTDVPDTTYYRRRLATGELLRAPSVTALPAGDAATTPKRSKA